MYVYIQRKKEMLLIVYLFDSLSIHLAVGPYSFSVVSSSELVPPAKGVLGFRGVAGHGT